LIIAFNPKEAGDPGFFCSIWFGEGFKKQEAVPFPKK